MVFKITEQFLGSPKDNNESTSQKIQEETIKQVKVKYNRKGKPDGRQKKRSTKQMEQLAKARVKLMEKRGRKKLTPEPRALPTEIKSNESNENALPVEQPSKQIPQESQRDYFAGVFG